jgi:hypothetical protein
MPLQNFLALTAEARHQRLQDFGFEAFFVGVSTTATPPEGGVIREALSET